MSHISNRLSFFPSHLLLGLSMLFSVSVLFAAPGLTINQLTKIAIQNNKDLQAARYNIKQAQARLIQAGLWSNPSLNLNNSDDRLITNEGEYTRSAGFSQSFPISGRISRQKNLARVDIALALTEIRNAKRLLRGSVADAAFALFITDSRLKLLNGLLTINKKLVEVTQNRYQAAEVSELDTNTASLEYQRILQEKQLLQSIRIGQVALLNQLLGRSATAPLRLNQFTPEIKQLPVLSTLQNTAIKQRPDMQMLWLSAHRAQADQQLAKAERWADWNLGVTVQQSKQVIQGAPPQNPDRQLSFGLTIPFPLLNGNQGRILETGAAQTQALTKIQALKLVIETEIASNYTQLQALRNTLAETIQGPLKLSLRNVRLAREAYKNGQISLLGVLQIQRQQYDLQVAYLTMREKYIQVLVKFCTALSHDDSSNLCPYLSDKRNLNAPSKRRQS